MFHRYTHPRLRIQWFGFVVLLGVFALSMGAAKTAVAEPTAAISLSTPYNQNFDSLSNTGTPTWTDDSTILGWYSNRNAYIPGTGSSNTGALYSFGAASSSERALGSVASGGTGTIYFGARLVNDTTHSISSLTVNYTGEQWRNGGIQLSNNLLLPTK